MNLTFVRSFQILLLGAIAIAIAGKLATPVESAHMLSQAVLDLYGLELDAWPAFGTAITADVVLAALVILTPRRWSAALALVCVSVTFCIHHALNLLSSNPVHCGCFGATPMVPEWTSPVTAAALMAFGAFLFRVPETVSRASITIGVACTAAWLLVAPTAGALGAPLVKRLVADEPAHAASRIQARDTWLFVYNPRCDSCLGAARRLESLAARGDVVGIAPVDGAGHAEFASRLNFELPTELVTKDLWFSMIESVPPAWYRIDATGALRSATEKELLEER